MRQLALAALVIGVTACGQAPMSSNGGTRYTVLHLTEPPTPVAANSRTPLAACSQNPGDESPTDTAQGQKLIADTEVLKARGIVLLEFYMCRGSLFIGVAVADKGTVDFLSTRYAPAKVTGWLQPVS